MEFRGVLELVYEGRVGCRGLKEFFIFSLVRKGRR